MRNIWFPSKHAKYMTQSEIKVAKEQDIIRARDFSFGKDVDKGGRMKQEIVKPDISIALLSVRFHRTFLKQWSNSQAARANNSDLG